VRSTLPRVLGHDERVLIEVQTLVEDAHDGGMVAGLQEFDFVEEIRPPLRLRQATEHLDREQLSAERTGGREHEIGFRRAAQPESLEASVL
jgi:hypothetical protein